MSKILIVDDEPLLRMLVRTTLAGDAYQILEAREGAEGLALARSERPDLVLLDIMMPGMDGFEVCRMLKADPDLSATPVVMLSARAGATDQAQGQAAGADEYLTKPFSPLELIQLVARIVGR